MKLMKFDELLTNHVGEFGIYQKWQIFLFCLPNIFTALHSFSWTFTAADIPYRCLVLDEINSNAIPFYPENDYSLWLYDNETGKVREPCKRLLNVSVNNWQDSQNFDWEVSESGQVLKACSNKDKCDECVDKNDELQLKWDNREIPHTAVQQWVIVCKRRWLKALINSVYFLGQLVGSLSWGILGDKYGRKPAFLVAILIQVLFGAGMAYVPWWPLFAVFRTVLGFTHPGIFMMGVLLAIEWLGPTRRMVAGGIIMCFFSGAQIILGGMAYFIRDYRHLQLAVTLPATIFIIYLWLVPESPRWLITHGLLHEANVVLQKAAKCNSATLPKDWHRHMESAGIANKNQSKECSKSQQKYGLCDLMKTPRLRRRTLLCSVILWPSVNMAYYGLAMNPNFLGGNLYLAFVVGGILDIVALMIYMFTMNTVGRKALFMLGFSIGAICLFSTLLLHDKGNTKMFFLLFGKMNMTGIQGVIYVFTPELFPSIIRSTATGLCSMFARAGIFGSCWISFLLVESSKTAVVVIYGTVCVLGAVATIFLPETTGQSQIETIEEAESFGSDQPIIVFGWQMTKKPVKLIVPAEACTDQTAEEGKSESVAQDGSKKKKSPTSNAEQSRTKSKEQQ